MSTYGRSTAKWFILFSVFAVVSIPVVLLCRRVLQNSRDVKAGACLVHIGAALDSYHEAHGSFPPAYVADETGRPKHSWRVLLLPHLGYDRLYKRYDFDEPWDGPNNRALAEEVCDIYGSATDPHGRGTMTRFLAVVGPGTAWPGERSVRREDFADYFSQTIVLLDCVESDVKWTEPRDLAYSDVLASEDTGNTLRIARMRPQGIHFLDATGALRTLPKDLSPDILKALLTINGGEKIDDEWDLRGQSAVSR